MLAPPHFEQGCCPAFGRQIAIPAQQQNHGSGNLGAGRGGGRAHALEHVGGAVGDHVAREKDTRVDSLGRQRSGERAVAKGGREVHALQARLAQLDDLLLAQEDDQVLEAATGTQSGFKAGVY